MGYIDKNWLSSDQQVSHFRMPSNRFMSHAFEEWFAILWHNVSYPIISTNQKQASNIDLNSYADFGALVNP